MRIRMFLVLPMVAPFLIWFSSGCSDKTFTTAPIASQPAQPDDQQGSTNTDQPAIPYAKIFGTWEWQYTLGGNPSKTLNPKKVGYTVTFVFTEDGRYMIYQDGVLTHQCTFRLDDPFVYNRRYYLKLYCDDVYDNNAVELNSSDNSLTITQPFKYGLSSLYVRVK